MPNWKKVIVSGSDASLNSLYVSGGITGSLLGTSSFATLAQTSNTASYIVTAQTASYVLQAVSASFATTASYVNPLNQDVSISGSLTVTGSYLGWFNSKMSSNLTNGLNGNLGYAALYNFDGYGGPVPNSPDNSWNESVISVGYSGRGLQIAGGYDTNNIYFRKGNSTWQSWSRILNATVDSYAANMDQNITTTSNVTFASLTSSLQGTASYATQALSASYAPSTPIFPYTGSAIISGSLEVTGSFYVENSIDSANKLLIGKGPTPVSFETAINWRDRWLIDSFAVTAMDWSQRTAYDAINASAIDWTNRFLLDSTGTTTSIDWGQRSLVESAGSPSINWDYPTQTQAVDLYSYTRKVIPVPTVVENFSYLSNYAVFNPTGEILEKVTLDGTVADYDLVYLETDAKWYPVDQTTDSSTKLLGIAYASGSTKDKVLLEGTMVVNDSTLTDCPQVSGVNYGLPVYIRTAGSGMFMSTIPPGTTGNYVRVLGHIYHQSTNDNQYWVMKFRPSNDWVQI